MGIRDTMKTQSPSAILMWKWMGFVTAIWVQCISGNNYTFANYSQDLKKVMNYDQVQLNTLSVAKDVGKSFGLVAGFCADLLPPWVILLIGSLVGLVGYGTQWLVVSQRIAPPPMWQMAIAMCLGGNSTTWMNTACLLTCLRNFAGSRGTISGLMKGYIGLSTAIFTVLCSSLFTGNSAAFLLLLALLPFAVNATAMVFMRPVPSSTSAKEDKEEQIGFSIVNVIAGALSFYLLAYSIGADLINSYPIANKLYATGLAVFLALPLIVPARLLILERSARFAATNAAESGSPVEENRVPLLKDAQGSQSEAESQAESSTVDTDSGIVSGAVVSHGEVSDTTARKLKLGDDHTAWDAILTFDFWVLFFTFLCGIGTGITVMNNFGQIGQSLGTQDVAIFISFISIFGFYGRIVAGSVSEHYARKLALPRPFWMGLAKLFMIFGYLYMGVGAPGSLYVGSIIVGAAYGVHITITVPTASEMFGLTNFGLMYNILVLNIPLGSFLFSGLLAGFLYDREAAKDSASGPNGFTQLLSTWLQEDTPKTCYGAHCFNLLFTIMAVTCAVGLLLDIFLTLRLRPLYQAIRRKRNAVVRLATNTDGRDLSLQEEVTSKLIADTGQGRHIFAGSCMVKALFYTFRRKRSRTRAI
ncbi:hypothetical protein R1flu_015778 [Riccia fluitans]|uniref:Nodulin-like domain-containing protein n=1 Tax=Riccia fluitans TaxID=41844 RepID=A0ABD1YN04_9MARC